MKSFSAKLFGLPNRKKTVALLILTLGLVTIVLPLLHVLLNYLLLFAFPESIWPASFMIVSSYAFVTLYSILVILGVGLGIVGLMMKPRDFDRRFAFIVIGLISVSFSVGYFGPAIYSLAVD